MTRPTKHGATYRVYVQRSDRRWQRVTTGTEDKKLAQAMGDMVRALIQRRDWTTLDAVCRHQVSLGQVWDSYRRDSHLSDFRAQLDDVDLEPFVASWHLFLKARGTASADRYVSQVRQLIPAGVRFPRSRFTRRVLSEHLGGRPVSGSTRNRERAALSQFARFLVEREVLETNPVRDVQSSKPNRARMRYLSRAEVQALIDALPQPYRALEAIMAATGAEWQACVRLMRRDIDLAARTVALHGSKTPWRNRVVRIVNAWAIPAIAEHVRLLSPAAPVFPGLDHHAALKAHHEAGKALKLERSLLHDHRHSFAVQALRDGLSATVVASQLGHSSAHLTYTVYGRFVVEEGDYSAMEIIPEQKASEGGK